MSGPRITRKVTVEVGKKVTESGNVPSSVVQQSSSSSSSSSTRRSVFERLGPGAVERPKGRDAYTPDKCRNWLRDGRCPYGSNCKFLHGPYTDPKPRTKSVRSIVHSGSKDRYDDTDEKQQLYHSRSFDSADYDDDDVREVPKLKRRHKSEEDLSDSSIKKPTKSKKKRKEDVDDDDEGKIKRKRKTHRKRDGSPKLQPRSSNDDEEEYDRPKNEGNWEEHGDLDFERQLELEKRRQDLQRQLALMDEEDAAASAGETDWKGKEKEEDQRKVPIIHSKLHPEPSPSTPDGEASTQVLKKKKKKKLDSEGKKTKVKKEASPRKKEETKRKVSGTTGGDEIVVKKDELINKKKKTVTEYVAYSDEGDFSEHLSTDRVSRKVSRHAGQTQHNVPHDSPPSSRADDRKRPEDDQIRQKREESKPTKDRRRVEMSSDDQGHVDEGRPRRAREASQDYYPSTDEQDEETRKVRSKVTGAKKPNEPKRIDEGMTDDRGRQREGETRGPRTPSPPPHAKDDRYYYDEQQEDSKKRRLPRGPPLSTPREPIRDESIQRKESRGRPDDPHVRGPRTPSDDEGRLSPPSQVDTGRGSRYGERERGPQRREPRERGPVGDQGDQRYPDRAGHGNMDPEYERRKPREEDIRGRRPPDNIRNRDDEYPKHRGRDDNYPRENREEDFNRHRSEREEIKDDRGKYRDERPNDIPVRSRAREEVDFPRGRGRDEVHEEGRGRPPQRDMHRRMHDDPEVHERDIRDERDRPRADYDSRGRYGGPSDTDHYRRPSPSQGPPRGRSPQHRYEDRRRPDETFRSGPGGRDPPGRGRAVGRGRSAYTSPYDSRGKMVDNRRRSPPPPGPRPSYQDRDRGPPRGRDVPMGRGRGYLDKGRPPNDRYRDPNAPWERRGERDYPPREPPIRDRRARESPPPPPAYRDERPWEENERRETPQQSGSFPAQERRDQYDGDRDSKGRMGNRERHSLDRGAPQWDYEDDANLAKPVRKRTRPVAERSESPFEAKKGRDQSPISPSEGPDVDNVSADAIQPDKPKKAAVVAKDGKKVKKKKKEGKVAKGAAVEGLIEVTAVEEVKPVKGEKKGKKEKKLKEKGNKKKKKAAVTAPDPVVPVIGKSDVQPVADTEQIPADKPPQPKVVKKRKQVTDIECEMALKEPDKPKKKKKKKHQPEVLVQPWNDLEGEEEQQEPVQEIPPENIQDDVFSDWSDDDSPVGDESWLDQDSQQPTIDDKDEPIKDSPVLDDKGPSFDDVYDPISDDEFDAMYTHSDDEELTKDEKETTKALGVEDVDWSSLGISHDVNKEKEPVSHLERFKPSYVFSRIGISPALSGQRLTQLVRQACAKPSDSESKEVEEFYIPEEGPKSIGAFVAAAAAKKRQREGLLGNLGPCRRALCARRDLAIRKQLGKSSKFGKLSLFAASPTTPGDNELFQMSVALYKKESASKDGVRIIPSKVGSILLSHA